MLLMMIEEKQKIAEWVVKNRQRVGYTIKRLAEKAGVSRSHLYAIEDGIVRPNIDTLFRLADAMNIPRQEVLKLLGISTYKEDKEVEVVRKQPSPLIPVIAVVPCGNPIEPEVAPLGYVPLYEGEAPGAAFAIRAEGDSMAPFILPGDFLIIRPQDTATNGDIIVVSIETDGGWESTVKRYRLQAGKVVLESLNPAYPNIEVSPPMRMRIIGKVVEIKRFLR